MQTLIVGEDEVTKAIIRKVISQYRTDIIIENELPARGGQIKKLAPNFNKIDSPIILLTDLDQYECAPSLIKEWFGGDKLSNNFCFRVACDEAESWLMSDREGFAKWMAIDLNLIPLPSKVNKKKEDVELKFKIKPSLFMMLKLAPYSKKEIIQKDLIPVGGASKGRGYNAALLPFIQNHWDIENARKNSNSLDRAIKRIAELK